MKVTNSTIVNDMNCMEKQEETEDRLTFLARNDIENKKGEDDSKDTSVREGERLVGYLDELAIIDQDTERENREEEQKNEQEKKSLKVPRYNIKLSLQGPVFMNDLMKEEIILTWNDLNRFLINPENTKTLNDDDVIKRTAKVLQEREAKKKKAKKKKKKKEEIELNALESVRDQTRILQLGELEPEVFKNSKEIIKAKL